MFIQHFPSGPFQTKAYVIACPSTREAAIIDPAPGSAEKIIDYIAANNLTPKMILLTHSHWDHIGDAAQLKEHYHLPLYVHQLDSPNLIEPGADGLPLMMTIEGAQPDQFLVDDEMLRLGTLEFKVIHTPGHTPGGVCFYFKPEETLIAGDTLFRGSIGNISFPTSDPEAMWESLKKLAKLPPETKVHPGHGLSTTIGKESWLDNAKQIFGDR